MKKLLFLILLISFNVFSEEKEKNIFNGVNLELINLNKETNGNYVLKMPHITKESQIGNFIQTTEVSLDFTSPRGKYNFNHHSVYVNNLYGIEIQKFYLQFGIDLRYFFDGNDYNIKEGFQFGNTLKIGYKLQ